MTITQTVDIPESRRITLEVPREVPTGKTRLVIQFPFQEDIQPKDIPQEAKGQLNNEDFRQALCRAHGAWKDNPWTNHLADINAIRDEWGQRNQHG